MNELITKGTIEEMKGKIQKNSGFDKQNLSHGQNCYCVHFWKSVRHRAANCSETAFKNIFVLNKVRFLFCFIQQNISRTCHQNKFFYLIEGHNKNFSFQLTSTCCQTQFIKFLNRQAYARYPQDLI